MQNISTSEHKLVFIIVPSVLEQFSDKYEYRLSISVSTKVESNNFKDMSIDIHDNMRGLIYKNYYHDNGSENISDIDYNLLNKFIISIEGIFKDNNPFISFGKYQHYVDVVDEEILGAGDIRYINGYYNIYVKILGVGTILNQLMNPTNI